MLIFLWLVVLMATLLLFFKQQYQRFIKHGVKYFPPVIPFGNILPVLMKKEHVADEIDRLYKAFAGEKFTGRFSFIMPNVVLRDIELVKNITVNDFEHFTDHRSLVNENTDPLFGRNLFSLTGEEWKDMRSTLSPAFTSSKMRLMLPLMVDVGKQMAESLTMKIGKSENNYIEMDVKELTTRYANDVIASCAFGLNVDSHSDENNQFYRMGKSTNNVGSIGTFVKIFMYLIFPELMMLQKLKITLFPESIKNFFKEMIMATMKDRETRNVVRPDMIHLLMEARKGKLAHEDKTNDVDAGFATVEESIVGKKNITRDWSDDDIVAQVILFLIAGFETVSASMSFALHELAVNPDIQERLVQEIRETNAKNGGKLDYNVIQNMKYMDMVVSEVLRLWPPMIQLDRVCVKDYNLGKANDSFDAKDYHIRAGEGIIIPVYSIHRDSQFFPEPLKFNPERFSEENKHKIQPFTYLPFGAGPRNCIGSRFALCEVKVLLYELLQHVEVSPNDKTCVPARLSKSTKAFNICLDGGHWLRLKIRN